MNNRLAITLFQVFPEQVLKKLKSLGLSGGRALPRQEARIIENIDHFETDEPKTKHALFSLSPNAWFTAVSEYPSIRHFNYCGLTYEIVRALNLNGYVVDIVDLNHEHPVTKEYDIFIGHGGNCRTTLDQLPQGTPVFQYISGAYWKAFSEESRQRYDRFAKSRGISAPATFRRDPTGYIGGEDYLLKRADCLFTNRCPRMVAAFGEHQNHFFFTGLGAYPDKNLAIPPADRDFEAGRRNFLYVGGTGGNIQKGMDVLLEAFAASPDLNLFIYCKVEDEILQNYRRELNLPNIKYIYHLRYPWFRPKLKRLMKSFNFTVHVPLNSGVGTAFTGTLALGLIPVGYIDLPDFPDCTVLAADWQVEAIRECLADAARKTADWCGQASRKIVEAYDENYSIDAVRARFTELFSDSNIARSRARRP